MTDVEATCQQCGGPNTSWVVDSDRFNLAMAAIGRDRAAIVCPICFIAAHERATGLTASWTLNPATPFRRIEQHATNQGPVPVIEQLRGAVAEALAAG